MHVQTYIHTRVNVHTFECVLPLMCLVISVCVCIIVICVCVCVLGSTDKYTGIEIHVYTYECV